MWIPVWRRNEILPLLWKSQKEGIKMNTLILFTDKELHCYAEDVSYATEEEIKQITKYGYYRARYFITLEVY